MTYNFTPEQRAWFASFCKPTSTDCVVWTGPADTYSRFGTAVLNRSVWKTHRLAYAMHHGELKDGKVVVHTCEMPLCVNIDHLREVNRRGLSGDSSPRSQLTEFAARDIKHSGVRLHVPHQVLADRYNVSVSTVYSIVTGRTWKHIPAGVPAADWLADKENHQLGIN